MQTDSIEVDRDTMDMLKSMNMGNSVRRVHRTQRKTPPINNHIRRVIANINNVRVHLKPTMSSEIAVI